MGGLSGRPYYGGGMSDLLDYAGVQRLWSKIKSYVDGKADLASWHVLELADTYNTGGTDNIEAYLRNTLPLASMKYYGSDMIKLKPLDVQVGAYTWATGSDPNTDEATADVSIVFPDGSMLSKQNVHFVRPNRVNGRVYAARPEGKAYVDTGLTMDYSYEFEVEGYVNAGNGQQAVLMGALSNNSHRTTLRVFGGSNKIQVCWPSMNEVTSSSAGIDFTSMFKYDIKPNLNTGRIDVGIHKESNGDYSTDFDLEVTGASDASILLFNETPDADYSRGILREAIIRDSNGNTLRQFQPWYLDGEIVMVDVANNNQVYRPAKGVLVEVTA